MKKNSAEVDELVVGEVWYPLNQGIYLRPQEVQRLKVLGRAEAGVEEPPRDHLVGGHLGYQKLAVATFKVPAFLG